MRMFIVWKNEIYYGYPSLKIVLNMPLLELKEILEEAATVLLMGRVEIKTFSDRSSNVFIDISC